MVHATPTIQSSLKLHIFKGKHSMFGCWPDGERSFPRYIPGKTSAHANLKNALKFESSFVPSPLLNRYWIPELKLGLPKWFCIPWAEWQIPKPWIPYSGSKKFQDCEIWITLQWKPVLAKLEGVTWSACQWLNLPSSRQLMKQTWNTSGMGKGYL